MRHINKIFNYRLSDTITLIYYLASDRLSLIYGTFMFRLKAFLFGVKAGTGVKCWGSIDIVRGPKSQISIGDNVSIVSSSMRCSSASLYANTKLRTYSPSSKIIIEKNAGLNGTSITARSRTVRIGEGAMIAPNCMIVDSDFHSFWPPDKRIADPGLENDRDVVIGKNVWIGAGCIILKGAVIGENSVIGAGSIVTRAIPANVIAAGNPAKVIKDLG